MATSADAELILKLYELRQNDRLRAARNWVLHEFHPRTLEDLLVVQRDFGSEPNQYWRQVIGYWEMASALVLRGALDSDLFFDSVGENVFLYAKFAQFHQEFAQSVPGGFMPSTVAVIERNPAVKERALRLRAHLNAQNSGR